MKCLQKSMQQMSQFFDGFSYSFHEIIMGFARVIIPDCNHKFPFLNFSTLHLKSEIFHLEKFEFILPERRSREKRQDWYCYHGSLFRCFQFEMLTILLLHYVDRQGQMDLDLASLWYLLSLGGHGGIPRSSPSKWKIHITKLSLNVHTFTLKLRIPCPIGKVASPLIFKGCPALCFALVSTFSSVFPVRSTG